MSRRFTVLTTRYTEVRLDAYANRCSYAGQDMAGEAEPGSPHGFTEVQLDTSALSSARYYDLSNFHTPLRAFTFLHTFNNFFRALSAVFVGPSLHLVEFIAVSCSTFHNHEIHSHACCQPVTPPASPPHSEPIAALSGLRPRNGQSAACNCRMAYGPARKCNQSQG